MNEKVNNFVFISSTLKCVLCHVLFIWKSKRKQFSDCALVDTTRSVDSSNLCNSVAARMKIGDPS